MRRLVFIALVFPIVLLAQQKSVDSLLAVLPKLKEDSLKVNALNKLSRACIKIDSVKGFSYARQALALSKKIQWNEGISKSNYVIGLNYNSNFAYQKALAYFNSASQQTADKKLQSKIFTAIGSVYINTGNYSKSLAAYHHALKLDEAVGDKMGIAQTSMNIASVYFSIKDYPKSLTYFNKSLQQKVDDKPFLIKLFRNLAVVYNNIGQQKKALEYFEKSLLLSREIKDDASVASILSDIALVYYDKEDYDKAIDYSKASLKASHSEIADKVNLSFSYGIIGDSYAEKAKMRPVNRVLLDSALTYLMKAIKIHEELHNIRGLYDDYVSLTETQKLKGDYKTALKSFETSIVYKDSIFNSDNRETIKNIEDKRSIEIRDKELKINKLKLEAEQRQRWYLIAGLASLCIIGGMLFYQSNNRKKTNRKLNAMNAGLDHANKVKTRLLGILNHDLRSPVNSFIHFIQIQNESPELLDEPTKNRIANTTLTSAKNLLYSMEDILLWTKDQMENFEPQPETVSVDSLFDDLKKHFSSVKNVDILFENPENLTLFTDEDYLKTILRNLIANAVNALDGIDDAAISVKAFFYNEKQYLSVSDNGPGGTAETFHALYDEMEIVGIKTGLGLHLIRDLAKAINCKISVDTKPGGTVIIISFE